MKIKTKLSGSKGAGRGLGGVTKMRPGTKRSKLPNLASGGEQLGASGLKKTMFTGRAQFGR